MFYTCQRNDLLVVRLSQGRSVWWMVRGGQSLIWEGLGRVGAVILPGLGPRDSPKRLLETPGYGSVTFSHSKHPCIVFQLTVLSSVFTTCRFFLFD